MKVSSFYLGKQKSFIPRKTFFWLFEFFLTPKKKIKSNMAFHTLTVILCLSFNRVIKSKGDLFGSVSVHLPISFLPAAPKREGGGGFLDSRISFVHS